jgi:hypothetical protein
MAGSGLAAKPSPLTTVRNRDSTPSLSRCPSTRSPVALEATASVTPHRSATSSSSSVPARNGACADNATARVPGGQHLARPLVRSVAEAAAPHSSATRTSRLSDRPCSERQSPTGNDAPAAAYSSDQACRAQASVSTRTPSKSRIKPLMDSGGGDPAQSSLQPVSARRFERHDASTGVRDNSGPDRN